jgi:Bacterial NAD-glutamate dehydrogenase
LLNNTCGATPQERPHDHAPRTDHVDDRRRPARSRRSSHTETIDQCAKGGFFPKRLPLASQREAWLAEGVASYKLFISTLLDLTDNIDADGHRHIPRRLGPQLRIDRHLGRDHPDRAAHAAGHRCRR